MDAADPINGVLYLTEGDYKNAGISFGAMVPIVGSAGTVKRTVKNADEAAKKNKGTITIGGMWIR